MVGTGGAGAGLEAVPPTPAALPAQPPSALLKHIPLPSLPPSSSNTFQGSGHLHFTPQGLLTWGGPPGPFLPWPGLFRGSLPGPVFSQRPNQLSFPGFPPTSLGLGDGSRVSPLLHSAGRRTSVGEWLWVPGALTRLGSERFLSNLHWGCLVFRIGVPGPQERSLGIQGPSHLLPSGGPHAWAGIRASQENMP